MPGHAGLSSFISRLKTGMSFWVSRQGRGLTLGVCSTWPQWLFGWLDECGWVGEENGPGNLFLKFRLDSKESQIGTVEVWVFEVFVTGC